ncbi:MAG: DUF4263 domain-containing protein [Firmicutes bacterium]|nr:DUF4263 domain-containing protein [Bacillota bacterium]
MQFVDIKIESVSKDVAECNAVVLKCNDTFRYLFVPKLIDNSNDKSKCISGQFIVQKKSRIDKWENHDFLPINKMVKDQWINLDLSTSSMDILISYVQKLRELYLEEGKYDSFGTIRTFVFSNKLNSEEKEIILDMFDKNDKLKEELRKYLKDDISIEDVVNAIGAGKLNINQLVNKLNETDTNQIYNTLQAKMINPVFLEDNLDNEKEKFWQDLFKQHPNILSTIIPSVVHIIEDQPYFGGKAIDNKGGTIGDFLYKSGTNNVSIIEIKTPSTDLLGTEYRNDVFCPSKELSGSIIQIRKQKDNLMKEYDHIKRKSIIKEKDFDAYDPKSYIILGNSSKLNPIELESFELFRNSLKDIEIITFNELIEKLKIFQKYITQDFEESIEDIF